MNNKNSFLKKLIIAIIAAVFFVIMLVLIIDPFYHYHSPFLGLKKVQTEPEYQVIGAVRNFDYDAILLGSSVAENFDNSWFDEGFNCKSIKAIKKSGTTAYLTYFLEEAYKNHKLNYVFYSLDSSALLANPEYDMEEDGLPIYLFDHNIFNDVYYIFNKDIIFEKIPYMIAQTISGYNENESYNWAQYKSFSKEIAESNYHIPEERKLGKEELNELDSNIADNIGHLENIIKVHPETEFYFWIPPYSSLWRDEREKLDEMNITNDAIAMAREHLSQYDNVKFISFLDDRDITDNLDNYMDTVHFSQEINYYIYENIRVLK